MKENKIKIILEPKGHNESFGVLINGTEQIKIRQVDSPYYGQFICARDCSEKTNNRIIQIAKECGWKISEMDLVYVNDDNCEILTNKKDGAR